ncbi:MAG: HAD-IA family hydrolase [Acidobacteria bacterium]|nr:HAD-IA family hydrolase [Acidobacteriota bacterium]
MAPSSFDLVLLDAFGTLVAMDPPAPVLRAELAAAGHHFDEQAVQRALDLEIAHYRARMHIGRDRAGLDGLRAECGQVLADALGPGAPPAPEATRMLVASLRFRLHDDALGAMDALEARGVRLGVVSNWDCALPDHLAALGVAHRFVVIAVSAPVGAAKPDPAIFLHATTRAGVDPRRVLHVGDRRVEDYQGARDAGLQALLLDRTGAAAGPDVITTLADIPAIIGR